MKETGMLYTGPMVRATLEDLKTNTRRPIVPQPAGGIRKSPFVPSGLEDGHGGEIKCRFGGPGDRIWVRETIKCIYEGNGRWQATYAADRNGVDLRKCPHGADKPLNPTISKPIIPSIHMPRWASRITLEIVSVRVERLCNILNEDALKEGVMVWAKETQRSPTGQWPESDARLFFTRLWDSIYGKKYPWAMNPWIWAIEFKRVTE